MFLFQDEEMEALLAADFEIGHFFRERFIPKVSHFSTLNRNFEIYV